MLESATTGEYSLILISAHAPDTIFIVNQFKASSSHSSLCYPLDSLSSQPQIKRGKPQKDRVPVPCLGGVPPQSKVRAAHTLPRHSNAAAWKPDSPSHFCHLSRPRLGSGLPILSALWPLSPARLSEVALPLALTAPHAHLGPTLYAEITADLSVSPQSLQGVRWAKPMPGAHTW